MTLVQRIGKAALATLFGWIAGWIAALPFQIVEAIRNAGTDVRLLISVMGFAIALWTLLTFAVAVYCYCLFLLPIVWLVSPSWFLRRRTLWIALSTLFGVLLIAFRAHVWTAFDHDGVGFTNFWVWGVFATLFCLVTSFFYVRFLRATQPAEDAVTNNP
jgi:hypothetical protein